MWSEVGLRMRRKQFGNIKEVTGTTWKFSVDRVRTESTTVFFCVLFVYHFPQDEMSSPLPLFHLIGS